MGRVRTALPDGHWLLDGWKRAIEISMHGANQRRSSWTPVKVRACECFPKSLCDVL
jgi:hypothetical protein